MNATTRHRWRKTILSSVKFDKFKLKIISICGRQTNRLESANIYEKFRFLRLFSTKGQQQRKKKKIYSRFSGVFPVIKETKRKIKKKIVYDSKRYEENRIHFFGRSKISGRKTKKKITYHSTKRIRCSLRSEF